MIDTSKYFEPTEKYVTDWKDSFMGDNFKSWFNADLLCYVSNFNHNGMDEPELLRAYDGFCKFYEITITPKELMEKFAGITKEEIDELKMSLIISK